MKINKSSWHYRVLDSWGATPKTSLCTYFWQVVGHCLLSLVMLAVLLLMIAMFGVMPLVAIAGVISTGVYMPNEFPTVVLQIELAVLAMVVLKVLADRWMLKQIRSKEPSLVVEFVKAKKQKYCPTVEFVNED